MKIVTVIPLEKGAFKSDLTYFTSQDIKNGSIVSVPIRNKKILALTVSCQDVSNLKSGIKGMSFKLKKISEVKKYSVFKSEFLESTFLLSSYFFSKKNNGVISLIPSLFREKYDEISKYSNEENLIVKNLNTLEIDKSIKNEKLLLQTNLEDRISFYKTLIRGYFAQKKSVFIVLPTEYDIEFFEQALSKGIENFTFSVYRNLKAKKLLENYKKIIDSSHGVLILGTAQYLSIPRNDLGVIIVEHESSNAYKMIPKPHFDLRTFAEIYASKINAKFILSDTLLRFETIARKETNNLGEVYPISFRTNLDRIKINTINPNPSNLEALPPLGGKASKFMLFSEHTLEKIEETLKNNRKIFIYSLRKGLATYTVCKDCGETINCEECMAPVVLYLSRDGKKRMFACNRCNIEKDPETKCSTCGSWNLMPLGIGTDTVYDEVKKNFPKIKIFKLDKESVKTAKQAEKIINDFNKSQSSILIGTEMAFFYLREKVDLSIIASFDSLWSIPNFKMSERIIQILLSIISRTEKNLIIQTKNEKDSALLAVKSENLLPFVRSEIEDRKILNYPPFKRFIKITHLGDKESSIEAKKLLQELLKEYNPEIFSGFISKNKNQYTTNALIRVEPRKWSLPEISIQSLIDQHLFNLLSSLPPEYEILIDPEDLL